MKLPPGAGSIKSKLRIRKTGIPLRGAGSGTEKNTDRIHNTGFLDIFTHFLVLFGGNYKTWI